MFDHSAGAVKTLVDVVKKMDAEGKNA